MNKTHPRPWSAVGDVEIKDANGSLILERIPYEGLHFDNGFLDGNGLEEIVSCVNACAGINPEALPAFISAVENLRDMKGRHNTAIAYDRLMEALAKLKPTPA